ncbi:MAG: hypothetical protein R3C68_09190 [Myxococcota bacterium]
MLTGAAVQRDGHGAAIRYRFGHFDRVDTQYPALRIFTVTGLPATGHRRDDGSSALGSIAGPNRRHFL